MTLQKNLIKTAQANKLHKKANFLAFSAFIFALFLSFFMALHSQAVLAADEAVAPALPPSQGSVPDAGRIMQEIERDQNAKPPQALPEIEDSEPEALPDAEEASVVIRQFKFQGNKVVSSEALSQALVSITNHEVTITQLKASVDLISEHYRKQGYLAIATLPDQDITDGEVTMLITEAVFGGVKFDGTYGKDFKRVRPGVIESMLGLAKQKGKAFNQDQLEAGLAKVDNLAGIKIQSSMQAGQAEGTTDLLVKVKDQPLLNAYLALDNAGSRSTGSEKATVYLSLASPFGLGDTLNATMLHSEGTDYVRMAYAYPLAGTNLQLTTNASYMTYDVVASEFKSQELNGHSSNFGVGAQYPLYQSKNTKLKLDLDFEKKLYINKAYDATEKGQVKNSDYDVQVATLTVGLERFDTFIAGAQNNASLNFGIGKVNLDGSANQNDDAKFANTQGNYSRVRWNLSRNQFLTDSLSLYVSGSGQFANGNLDSSEKFYLGGVNGVRAYPTSEGGGSEGYLYVLELRKYLANNFTLAGFLDYGHIKQYENNEALAGNPLVSLNSYNLKGYGASLAWQGPYGSNIKGTYAHRIGNNPNPIAKTGADQDGTLDKNVLWLSGSLTF